MRTYTEDKTQLACEDGMRRHDGWREDPENCQRRPSVAAFSGPRQKLDSVRSQP